MAMNYENLDRTHRTINVGQNHPFLLTFAPIHFMLLHNFASLFVFHFSGIRAIEARHTHTHTRSSEFIQLALEICVACAVNLFRPSSEWHFSISPFYLDRNLFLFCEFPSSKMIFLFACELSTLWTWVQRVVNGRDIFSIFRFIIFQFPRIPHFQHFY